MTAITKFMFDIEFDSTGPVAAPVKEEPPEPAPEEEAEEEEEEEELPGYSEAQLEEAKAESFESGKLEGAREAASTIEKETLQTLQAISQHITELFGKQEQANSVLLRDSIGIATTITRKLFPAMNESNSLGEVSRLVEHTLLRLIEEPRVVIRVNPDLLEALGERVDGLKAGAGYEGRIVLKEDTALPYGDCRMEWGDGSAERNVAALWQSIDDIVNGNLGIESDEEADSSAVEISALPVKEPVVQTPEEETADSPVVEESVSPEPTPEPVPEPAEETASEPVQEAAPESEFDENTDSPEDAPLETELEVENASDSEDLSDPGGEGVAAEGDDGIVGELEEDTGNTPDETDDPEHAPDAPVA